MGSLAIALMLLASRSQAPVQGAKPGHVQIPVRDRMQRFISAPSHLTCDIMRVEKDEKAPTGYRVFLDCSREDLKEEVIDK